MVVGSLSTAVDGQPGLSGAAGPADAVCAAGHGAVSSQRHAGELQRRQRMVERSLRRVKIAEIIWSCQPSVCLMALPLCDAAS